MNITDFEFRFRIGEKQPRTMLDGNAVKVKSSREYFHGLPMPKKTFDIFYFFNKNLHTSYKMGIRIFENVNLEIRFSDRIGVSDKVVGNALEC